MTAAPKPITLLEISPSAIGSPPPYESVVVLDGHVVVAAQAVPGAPRDVDVWVKRIARHRQNRRNVVAVVASNELYVRRWIFEVAAAVVRVVTCGPPVEVRSICIGACGDVDIPLGVVVA